VRTYLRISHARKAGTSYRKCLADETSFVPWTLEEIVGAVKAEGGGGWIDTVARQYLAFEEIDALVAASSRRI
jgi:hypothetical protein